MVGILIVTHGNLGIEIIKSAELIMGKQEKIKALALNHGDNVEKLKEEIHENIKELDDGSGVIVATDFFGGSPTNATLFNMRDLEFEAVTGINLPMLLELLCQRAEMSLEDLAKKTIDSGIEGIKSLNEALKSGS